MKAKTFENLIRKVVREEIDYALRREIKSLKEDLRDELKPTIVEHKERMVEVPNNSTADTNNKGEGTAGDGTGGEDGGAGGNSGLLGAGTKGDQLAALHKMLQEGSPEEIISKMALRRGGDDEYIRYIRNARFQTIGYERFNAAVNSLDTTRGVNYPYSDVSKNIAPETRIDAENELPEFPDLVRGRQSRNILKRNLKNNPNGPDPDKTSFSQNGGSY